MHLSNLLKQNVVGKLLNHGIVFLINIEIVRLLGASTSGFYFNELYLINFFAFMGSIGLDYAAIAWIANQPQLQRKIHRAFIWLSIVFIAFFSTLIFFILPEKFVLSQQSSIAIVLLCAGNLLLILFQGLLSAIKKFQVQNTWLIITNILFLLGLYWIEIFHIQTYFQAVCIGYGSLFFIQGLLMCFMSFSNQQPGNDVIAWKPFFQYGLNIMLTSLVFYVFLRVDNFFVERYCDAVALSNYVQCGKVGQYFLYFASIVSSTLLPFFSSHKMPNSFANWKSMVRPYVLMMFVGALMIGLFGNVVFPFIFGVAFKQMQSIMLILLPGYFCLGLLTLVNVLYLAKKNIKRIVIGDIMGLLIVVIFDALLIPTYGVYAAAIISTIAYCMVFLFVWWDAKKQFH